MVRSWSIWRTSTATARTNVPCPHERLTGLLEGMFVGDEVLLDVSFTAARARLVNLLRGGLLLSASEDAYGQGITGLVPAVLRDPQGATFSVLQPLPRA